jgi:hypothetical protein
MDRCLTQRLFPLTPALSLREREDRSPRSGCHDATALRALADFPPRPEGEGRGEGERLKNAKDASETSAAPSDHSPESSATSAPRSEASRDSRAHSTPRPEESGEFLRAGRECSSASKESPEESPAAALESRDYSRQSLESSGESREYRAIPRCLTLPSRELPAHYQALTPIWRFLKSRRAKRPLPRGGGDMA